MEYSHPLQTILPITIVFVNLPNVLTEGCGPPSQIRYASVSRSADRMTAEYRCERWYLFPDGNRTKSIKCVDGFWAQLPGSCLPGLCAPDWSRYTTSCFQFRHQLSTFSDANDACMLQSFANESHRVGLDASGDHNILASLPKRSRYMNDVTAYFTDLISQHNRSLSGEVDMSGRYWLNLFPAHQPINVRSNSGGRVTIPNNQAVVLVVNYTDAEILVDLEFTDVNQTNYFLCQDHIYCPPISETEDKTAIYADKVVVPHEDKTLCPNSVLEAICRDGLWRFLACSAPTVPVYTYAKCPAINTTEVSYPSHARHHVGSTVLVHCTVGHHYHDKSSYKRYTCNASGFWIPTREPCIKDIMCPAGKEVTAVSCNASLVTPQLAGTVRKCQCDPGRMFHNAYKTHISVCLNNGSWDVEIGDGCTVQGTNCPEPPPLINAVAITAKKAFHVNSSIIYICDEGKQWPDATREVTATCEPDGTWKYPFDECEDIKCRSINRVLADLRELTNERAISAGALPLILAGFPFTYVPVSGMEVLSICINGTFPDGDVNRTSVCTYHDWRPALPLCGSYDIPQIKRRIRRYQPPIVEAPGGATIGSIAMIFVLVFLTGIFILDLINLKKAIGIMIRNVSSFFRYYCGTTTTAYIKTPSSAQHEELKIAASEDVPPTTPEETISRSPSKSSLLSNYVDRYETLSHDGAVDHIEMTTLSKLTKSVAQVNGHGRHGDRLLVVATTHDGSQIFGGSDEGVKTRDGSPTLGGSDISGTSRDGSPIFGGSDMGTRDGSPIIGGDMGTRDGSPVIGGDRNTASAARRQFFQEFDDDTSRGHVTFETKVDLSNDKWQTAARAHVVENGTDTSPNDHERIIYV